MDVMNGWPERPQLPEPPSPDLLPVDAFPKALREFIETVAESHQVAPDMVAVLVLSAVSAAAAGKAVVRPDDAWTREALPFWGVVVAESAERKSAIFHIVTAPLFEWEAMQERALRPKIKLAQDVLDVREQQLKAAIKGLASHAAIPQGTRTYTNADVEDARNALEAARSAITAIPRIVINDVTPEAVVQHMAEQSGRIAIMSAEAGPLRMIAGRYSGSARLEEAAHGYDHETIHVRRMGRDPLRVERPSLTLGLTIQPSVLETLQNKRSMRGQGIYARISWVLPPPRAGYRQDSSEVAPLDAAVVECYRTVLQRLLAWNPPQRTDDGIVVPEIIELSAGAQATKREFHYELEPCLRCGAELHDIADWAGKAVGRAIRIAALIELAERADAGKISTDPISQSAMENGARICRSLVTHARALFARVEQDESTARLRHVLETAQALPAESTVADLHQKVLGRRELRSIADVEAALNELADRGCLRLRSPEPTGKPGRPPSPVIELHPAFS